MNTKLVLIGVIFVLSTVMPPGLAFAAQVQQLNPTAEPTCYNFTTNLSQGAGGDKDLPLKAEVLKLQTVLIQEGFPIRVSEFGTFSTGTLVAVKGFQEKYKDEILAPVGLKSGSGYVGPVTRLKLALLYGCGIKSTSPSTMNDGSVRLNVSGILFDDEGISVTFCNRSPQNVPTFPVRVRLNGIVREFDIVSARTGNTCYPARWSYESWGLSYDPDTIFTSVVTIDPFGFYKQGELSYPDLEDIAVPAVEGIQLSVRSLIFKGEGIQSTFCNMGTINLPTYPVKIIVNGVSKDFDVTGAHQSGKCQPMTWPFTAWGLTYSSSTVYNVLILVDPEYVYKDFTEFNNAGAIRGIP